MFSAKGFEPPKVILLEFVGMLSLRRRLQEWIRQQIVDNDPYDQATFFPPQNDPADPVYF